MRKILIVILMVFSLVGLTSCRDKQIRDDAFNVIFYVGPSATPVDTYFDVEEGSKIERPEDPTRDGFLFEGWYKEIQRENLWDFENDIIESSTVLYAKWVSAVWTLTFVLSEELSETFNNPDDVPTEFTIDENVYLPRVSRPGGSYRGWILVHPDDYTLDMKVYRMTSELPYLKQTSFTLYPIFNNNKYMITFISNMEGVKPAPKTGVEYGSLIDWLPDLQDTATHRFVGWFTKNGKVTGEWGVQIVNGEHWIIPSPALLYGKWEEK